MSSSSTITIQVNGDDREIAAGASIADMVRDLGFDPTRVAVERNLEVVPRSTLGEIAVADGDKFEIVRFVGGG